MREPFASLPNPACGGADHTLHRRKFLQGMAGAGAFSLMSWGGLFSLPAFAEQAKRAEKRCILLWLCGAPSQFETWDPKPGRPSGGPFRSIPTKLPGIHFSELMPKCASIADKLAVVRSMKTAPSEHLQGIDLLSRGAPPRPPFDMEKLPAQDRERYGPGAFAQHTLQARHLVENGAPFVMVANGMPWDSQVFHNEIYQMLVPEMDRVIFNLISDLEERGMLRNTLVIAMGEFGRARMVAYSGSSLRRVSRNCWAAMGVTPVVWRFCPTARLSFQPGTTACCSAMTSPNARRSGRSRRTIFGPGISTWP